MKHTSHCLVHVPRRFPNSCFSLKKQTKPKPKCAFQLFFASTRHNFFKCGFRGVGSKGEGGSKGIWEAGTTPCWSKATLYGFGNSMCSRLHFYCFNCPVERAERATKYALYSVHMLLMKFPNFATPPASLLHLPTLTCQIIIC